MLSRRNYPAKARSVLPGSDADRGHWAGEIAALSLVALVGAVLAAWRASQHAEKSLDARTRERLLPLRERARDAAGAD